MNSFIKKMIPFILVIFFNRIYAQSSLVKDTSLMDRIHKTSLIYSLTPSQEAAFLSLERSHRYSIDSVGRLNLSPEQTGQWLATQIKWYDGELKNIFNDKQWKKYLEIRNLRTQQFKAYAREKKIRVTAVPENDR